MKLAHFLFLTSFLFGFSYHAIVSKEEIDKQSHEKKRKEKKGADKASSHQYVAKKGGQKNHKLFMALSPKAAEGIGKLIIITVLIIVMIGFFIFSKKTSNNQPSKGKESTDSVHGNPPYINENDEKKGGIEDDKDESKSSISTTSEKGIEREKNNLSNLYISATLEEVRKAFSGTTKEKLIEFFKIAPNSGLSLVKNKRYAYQVAHEIDPVLIRERFFDMIKQENTDLLALEWKLIQPYLESVVKPVINDIIKKNDLKSISFLIKEMERLDSSITIDIWKKISYKEGYVEKMIVSDVFHLKFLFFACVELLEEDPAAFKNIMQLMSVRRRCQLYLKEHVKYFFIHLKEKIRDGYEEIKKKVIRHIFGLNEQNQKEELCIVIQLLEFEVEGILFEATPDSFQLIKELTTKIPLEKRGYLMYAIDKELARLRKENERLQGEKIYPILDEFPELIYHLSMEGEDLNTTVKIIKKHFGKENKGKNFFQTLPTLFHRRTYEVMMILLEENPSYVQLLQKEHIKMIEILEPHYLNLVLYDHATSEQKKLIELTTYAENILRHEWNNTQSREALVKFFNKMAEEKAILLEDVLYRAANLKESEPLERGTPYGDYYYINSYSFDRIVGAYYIKKATKALGFSRVLTSSHLLALSKEESKLSFSINHKHVLAPKNVKYGDLGELPIREINVVAEYITMIHREHIPSLRWLDEYLCILYTTGFDDFAKDPNVFLGKSKLTRKVGFYFYDTELKMPSCYSTFSSKFKFRTYSKEIHDAYINRVIHEIKRLEGRIMRRLSTIDNLDLDDDLKYLSSQPQPKDDKKYVISYKYKDGNFLFY